MTCSSQKPNASTKKSPTPEPKSNSPPAAPDSNTALVTSVYAALSLPTDSFDRFKRGVIIDSLPEGINFFSLKSDTIKVSEDEKARVPQFDDCDPSLVYAALKRFAKEEASKKKQAALEESGLLKDPPKPWDWRRKIEKDELRDKSAPGEGEVEDGGVVRWEGNLKELEGWEEEGGREDGEEWVWERDVNAMKQKLTDYSKAYGFCKLTTPVVERKVLTGDSAE